MLGCGNDGQFSDFCDRVHLNDLPSSAKFKTNELRVKNRDKLVAIINEIMQKKTNQEWNEALVGAKFPYGPVNGVAQVFQDAQVKHNEMVVEMDHATVGPVKVVGPAVKFSSARNQPQSPPPVLGQHSHHILSDILGYSHDHIDSLMRVGIVA